MGYSVGVPTQVRSSATAKDRDKMGETRKAAQAAYEIRVEGELDEDWVDWFDGMAIAIEQGATTLTGPLRDQPALRGMLSKLWDLNLTLVSLRRIEGSVEGEKEND
jgi:hypothetical protein